MHCKPASQATPAALTVGIGVVYVNGKVVENEEGTTTMEDLGLSPPAIDHVVTAIAELSMVAKLSIVVALGLFDPPAWLCPAVAPTPTPTPTPNMSSTSVTASTLTLRVRQSGGWGEDDESGACSASCARSASLVLV